MNCIFCNKEINNKGSLVSHQQCCKLNPNSKKHFHSPNAGAKKGCKSWNKDKTFSLLIWKQKYPLEDILVENSTYARHCLKKRILDENLIPYICKICGQLPIWQEKEMPLILDHINGVNNDNRFENLRFVCSNCDSQLSTYKSRNKKKKENLLGELAERLKAMPC